jgi:Domain of unknown function(DUF2779)
MPLPPKHILSKSTFMYGCQCPLRLWMHKYQPSLKDPVDKQQQQLFQSGTDLGQLARQLFPGGVDATPPDYFQYALSVKKTAEWIAAGKTIIYEAAFQHEGLLCAVDILVKKSDGWYAYEVKGSTRVKDVFVMDAAFQYHVITNAGLPLQQISLIYINNQYVRKGALALNELFTSTAITEQVKEYSTFLQAKSAELLQVVTNKSQPPTVVAGDQCSQPHRCDFYSHCNPKAELAVEEMGEPVVDFVQLQSFISTLQYPIYYMDFETWSQAVPQFDGHWPFRQVCFQYSVKVQHEPSAILEEYGYLANDISTPSTDFINSLLSVLGEEGTIVVYNATFERSRLLDFVRDNPLWEPAISGLINRMVDLMDVFRKKQYYLPEMGNSYSIKSILPALFPEEGYEGLAISDGMEAANAFYQLNQVNNPEKIRSTRAALEAYCSMDTLAMFKIIEHIRKCIQ